MIFIKTILKDFFNLFIPSKCLNCGINLHEHEKFVCKDCLFKIPQTRFHLYSENAVSELFWGRVKLEYAFSYYYFTKGSILQGLIHSIKYHHNKELAFELGKQFGIGIKDSDFSKEIELIVPVPLHPKKEKQRGYNQSKYIALGVSDIIKIDVSDNILKRKVYTSTQTKKSRIQRWENVKNAFIIENESFIKNKHIAILDDVVTTGATIEACANLLKNIEGVKVSVISLAYATD